MACDHHVVSIDYGNFDKIELLKALFQILDLLRAHDPRVLVVRDERGDFAGLGMPTQISHTNIFNDYFRDVFDFTGI